MLKLFALDSSAFNDRKKFEKYFALVCEERRQKIRALATQDKKNASLAAGVILQLALKECGVGGEISVQTGAFGKPYLTSPKGVFFNLSHSGNWAVIALSDGEVGVDVQQLKPANMRLATRFFSVEERQTLDAAGENATSLFYRLWTVKEAYLKALGTGLNKPLSSFSVRLTGGGAEICDPSAVECPWQVREYSSLKGYAAACCAKCGDFPQEIIELSI